MGAEFLTVEIEEDGTGSGGYAKEMSPEFIKAEMDLFARQCKEVDIIVCTALIPGKPAPKLITEEHVALLKHGSVIVDLAAEAGGNCVYTKKDELVNHNGVKIIGYTDFPSRLGAQSSALYANNITKFLSSMVSKDNKITYDLEDEVVGRAVVTHQGQKLWPNPKPLPMLDAKKPVEKNVKKEEKPQMSLYDATLQNAGMAGLGLSSFIGLGVLCPDPAFLGMVTTFSLAVITGYQSVWSVKPALHTPLMSITNAISGLTAAGGLLCLGGGVLPHTIPQALAAAAVLISSVNITGGFLITKRMLDMFRRPTDPVEYNWMYAGSGAAMMTGLAASTAMGVPHIHLMGYLASSICCIGAICGLSAQPTARIGQMLGNVGVMGGIFTTLLAMNFPLPVLTQALGLLGAGGLAGLLIGKKVSPTELP